MIELKTCPFCGMTEHGRYPPKIIEVRAPWSKPAFTVECENCQANCGYEGSQADAIVRWNDRPKQEGE